MRQAKAISLDFALLKSFINNLCSYPHLAATVFTTLPVVPVRPQILETVISGLQAFTIAIRLLLAIILY